jgi:hypothetical protein
LDQAHVQHWQTIAPVARMIAAVSRGAPRFPRYCV